MCSSTVGTMIKLRTLVAKRKPIAFIKPLDIIKCSLTIFIAFLIIPTYSFANSATVSSVDQVLGALAEVVKDRAKTVATEAIIDRLTSELCGDEEEIKNNPEEIKKIILDNEGIPQTFYLGGTQGCRNGTEKCNSDNLFVKACRIIKNEPNMLLTDPYFLKTLSRDTVGFAVRLSAYKLDHKQFESLNLEPFTDFIHAVMEQLAKGKTDMGAFSSKVDELANQYSTNEYYIQILSDIEDEATALDAATDDLIKNEKAHFADEIKKLTLIETLKEETTIGAKDLDGAADKLLKELGSVKNMKNAPEKIKDYILTAKLKENREEARVLAIKVKKISDAVNNLMEKPTRETQKKELNDRWQDNDLIFKNLFDDDKPFSKATSSKCSEAGFDSDGLIKTCRQAQLMFRLQDMVYRVKFDTTEDVKGKIRRFLYTLDESKIYRDAANGDTKFNQKYDSFSQAIIMAFKDRVQDGTLTHAAIADTLSLTAAVAQALTHESDDAIKWLRQFQNDLRNPSSIKTLNDLKSIPSLDWFKKESLPYYTGKMRSAFKHMFFSPQIYLYSWAEDSRNIDLIVKFAIEISSATRMITSNHVDKPSVVSVVNQLTTFIKKISENMPDDGDDKLKQFASALKSVSVILEHAQERDWVAVGFDINDQLNDKVATSEKLKALPVMEKYLSQQNNRIKYINGELIFIGEMTEKEKKDLLKLSNDKSYTKAIEKLFEKSQKSREFQNGLRFARTLLSMYQASSIEEAKGIFQATLEHQSSRKERNDQFSIDVAALAGFRAGNVWLNWDKSSTNDDSNGFGLGIYAPFGVQLAKKTLGLLIYPVDLGAYLSGSLADETAEIRVQSAIHTGIALYCRPWKKTPVVFGGSYDYKPRFADDDSSEHRVGGFMALELPLFIIK